MGYADIIIDLSVTGTTLRENHLKPISDGLLLASYACLIGNVRRLREARQVLEAARTLLEVFDATLNGGNYYQLSANVCGESPEAVSRLVAAHPVTRGLQGPTVASIYDSHTVGGNWYNVTVICHRKQIMAAVAHLRAIGGTQTTVIPVRYVFMADSPSYVRLVEQLG
jgi:ATP phosphoribosyltransferase